MAEAQLTGDELRHPGGRHETAIGSRAPVELDAHARWITHVHEVAYASRLDLVRGAGGRGNAQLVEPRSRRVERHL